MPARNTAFTEINKSWQPPKCGFQEGEITICVLDTYVALPDAFPKPFLEGE